MKITIFHDWIAGETCRVFPLNMISPLEEDSFSFVDRKQNNQNKQVWSQVKHGTMLRRSPRKKSGTTSSSTACLPNSCVICDKEQRWTIDKRTRKRTRDPLIQVCLGSHSMSERPFLSFYFLYWFTIAFSHQQLCIK